MLHTASGCPNKYEYTPTAFATATNSSRRGNNHICIIISMNASIQHDALTILKYTTRNCSYTWPIIVNNTGNVLQRNTEHVRVTTVAVEKRSGLHTLDFASTAVLIQHAMRTRRIILPYVAYTASLYFSTARFTEKR